MLRLALLFFLVALLASVFGFYGVASVSWEAAQIFFFVFLGLALLALVAGLLWAGAAFLPGRRINNGNGGDPTPPALFLRNDLCLPTKCALPPLSDSFPFWESWS